MITSVCLTENQQRSLNLLAKQNPDLHLPRNLQNLEFLFRFIDVKFEQANGVVPFQAVGMITGHPFYYRERGGWAQLTVARDTVTVEKSVFDLDLIDLDALPDDISDEAVAALPRKTVQEVQYPYFGMQNVTTLGTDVEQFRTGDGSLEWLETFLRLAEDLPVIEGISPISVDLPRSMRDSKGRIKFTFPKDQALSVDFY